MEPIAITILLAFVGVVFSIIGFLIKDKLDKNGREITKLFELHGIDAQALVDLQREIDRDRKSVV